MDAGDDENEYEVSSTESSDTSVEEQTRRRKERDDEDYEEWEATFREPGNAIERLFTSTSNATMDVLFHMFVTARVTITQMHRFCSVNSRARRACKREYIWLKMYWTKVIKEPEVRRLRGREPETRTYIENHLMLTTPEGIMWRDHLRLTKQNPEDDTEPAEPFVLLVAMVYYHDILKDDGEGLSLHDGSKNVLWINLAYPVQSQDRPASSDDESYRAYQLARNERAEHDIMVDIADPAYEDRIRDLISVRGERDRGIEAIVLRHNLLKLLIRAIKDNLEPGHVEYPRAFYPAPALLKTCLTCGTPKPERACGGRCGKAVYCGDECARVHWESGHYKTCTANKK